MAFIQSGQNAIPTLLKLLLENDSDRALFSFAEAASSSADGSALGIDYEDEISGRMKFGCGALKLCSGRLQLSFSARCPLSRDREQVLARIQECCAQNGFHIAHSRILEANYFPKESPVVDTLNCVFQKTTGLMWPPQIEEIEKIRCAQKITDRAFMDALNFIRPGMTDRELQKLIADKLWEEGSQMTSFNHVVGCGPDTADPHVRPTGRIAQKGELIMMDIGALVDGYGSDMTRMIALGKPRDEQLEIYALIQKAQRAGIAPSVPAHAAQRSTGRPAGSSSRGDMERPSRTGSATRSGAAGKRGPGSANGKCSPSRPTSS